MLTRPFIVTAILLQAALGNICMMPQAFASDAEILREEPMTMLMTPANLSVYEEPHSRGCDGYCMADTRVTTITLAPPALSTVASIVSAPYAVAEQFPRYTVVLPAALAPPTAIHISTIVLRL